MLEVKKKHSLSFFMIRIGFSLDRCFRLRKWVCETRAQFGISHKFIRTCADLRGKADQRGAFKKYTVLSDQCCLFIDRLLILVDEVLGVLLCRGREGFQTISWCSSWRKQGVALLGVAVCWLVTRHRHVGIGKAGLKVSLLVLGNNIPANIKLPIRHLIMQHRL